MSLAGLAQSNLGIQSKSGDLFTVQLDNEFLANNLDSIFKVFDLSFGTHTLDLTLENGDKVSKSIYLKNGTEHWFELKVDSNQSKISFYNTFPTAQSDTVTTGRTLINQPAVLNQLAPENSPTHSVLCARPEKLTNACNVPFRGRPIASLIAIAASALA